MPSKLVTFETFNEALSAYGGDTQEKLSRDTKLWGDLGVWGMDALDLFANLEAELGCSITGDFSIYSYLPTDTEIGLFGRLKAKRAIPDLTVGELFSMLQFLPKRKIPHWPY